MYRYNVKMSEELKQGSFDFPVVDNVHYVKIGATTVSQLKKAGLLPSVAYGKLSRNKPDGLILQDKNDVKVLVEYKKNGVINSEKDARKVLSNWYYELAKKVGCNVLCASDGNTSYWFHAPTKKVIMDEGGNVLRFVLDVAAIANDSLTSEDKDSFAELLGTFESLDESAQLTSKKVLNPQELAKKVWQKIWISTGKEPERCLYNVVEIFIFKFLSDLNILTGLHSFPSVFEVSKKDRRASLETYAKLAREKIRDMFPAGKDGTTVINGTIFVNEKGDPNYSQAGLFAEVLKEFAAFEKEQGSFACIDKNFKTRLYENFLRQSAGVKSLGQYFTPRNVVTSIIKMVNVDILPENAHVCDPFCGVGGFLAELINESDAIRDQFKPINGEIEPEIKLLGYDKGSDEKEDERTIILAKANLLIYLSDLISSHKDCMKEFSKKVFNQVFHLKRTNLGTFGIDDHADEFDLIVTNPPYVTSGVGVVKKELESKGLLEKYPSNGSGLEGLALEWIVDALKPGGRAFVVVPDGVMIRKNDKKLRERLSDCCDINAIISLPSRTFFATPKKTYILALTKKKKSVPQKNPIFTYLVSEIGETRNAKRFETQDNDLIGMAQLYRQFCATPRSFVSIDPRCKLIDVKSLGSKDWQVDKLWTDFEKSELNIQDESTELSENDFMLLLSSIGSDLSDLASDYKCTHTESIAGYADVELQDIIDFPRMRGVTEKIIHENEGKIPVYGGKKDGEPKGYIKENLPGVSYFEKCITWNRNGSVGYTFYRDHKFATTDDHRPMYVKEEFKDSLSIGFLTSAIQEAIFANGYAWDNKAGKEKIKRLFISIPVEQDGSYNFKAQEEIAHKYYAVKRIQMDAQEALKKILGVQVNTTPEGS